MVVNGVNSRTLQSMVYQESHNYGNKVTNHIQLYTRVYLTKYGKSSYAIVNVLSQSMFNQGKSLHVYVNVMSQSMLNQGKHIYVIVNYLFQSMLYQGQSLYVFVNHLFHSILNYLGISSENH